MLTTNNDMALHEGTGRGAPLGATVIDGGINFSLFSRSATGVELAFFDREDDAKPLRVIALDPVANRTYHYWHVFVPGVRPGQIYAYRVSGPSDPASGLRFDAAKVLLDPYGREVVVPDGYSREAASRAGDNAATPGRAVYGSAAGAQRARRSGAARGSTPVRRLHRRHELLQRGTGLGSIWWRGAEIAAVRDLDR